MKLWDEIADQLRHHQKPADTQQAQTRGIEPWFATLIRLAGEYSGLVAGLDRDVTTLTVDDLQVHHEQLTRDQVQSLRCRHCKSKPNSKGSNRPVVLFEDRSVRFVVDGNNRVACYLDDGWGGGLAAIIVRCRKTQ